MLKQLRYLIVVVTWPVVNLIDRLQGCDPPASFHRGLQWARGEHEPTIRTAEKPAAVRAPECKGAAFSAVAVVLAEGVEEHIRRDKLSPVMAAVFRSRGGHAPGEGCPSAAPAEPVHAQGCELLYDGDECTCGAWLRQADGATGS